MQHGEYILDRRLVSTVTDICVANGYDIRTYSDDWVLEISNGDTIGKIFGYKFSLNDSAAANIAQDKVASYQLLTAHDVPAVAHYLLRTKAGAQPLSLPGEVVLKPLVGTSGHLVRAFASIGQVREYIDTSTVEAWAVSPRLAIAREMRLIVLDSEVILSYEKLHPQHNSNLAMFNLGKGAQPQDIEPNAATVQLAQHAARALGLRVCAVDIIELEDGSRLVLEINDGIMMEYYSRYSAENAAKMRATYDAIVKRMVA